MSGSRARVARPVPPRLQALIAANAVLWAGEAEVFSTYFASPHRSAATDEVWLARQCYKEMVDGVVGRLASVSQGATFESTLTTAATALADEVVRAELAHYILFGIALQISRSLQISGNPRGSNSQSGVADRVGSDWPENVELQTLRAQHRREHGAIGLRAQAFTEGGYCTLYRAGAALKGGTALDDAIAAACLHVFDDELDHMLQGIAGLADAHVPTDEWALLEALTVAQGRCRIRMRNAQFGYPLSAERVRALEAGAADPLAFDYTRAALIAP